MAVSSVDLRSGAPGKVLDPTLCDGDRAVAASATDDDWWAVADAGVLAFALFLAIWHFSRVGLGHGDVRLAGVLGVGLGWLGLPEA